MTTERTLIRLYDGRWVWSDEELSGTVTESTGTPVPDLKINVHATANGINSEKELAAASVLSVENEIKAWEKAAAIVRRVAGKVKS